MITINDNSYVGKQITITNGKIIIDGEDVTPENTVTIDIRIHGNIDSLSADACNKISVSGNAGTVKTMTGDVNIQGSVSGSVNTMSVDVKCKDIKGGVTTMSGDVYS